MKDLIDLIARIFLSSIFIFEAIDSIVYFEKTKETMSIYGINWSQDFLLVVVIIILIIGASLVLIGYHSKFGASLLLVYYLPLTFIVFSFWNDPPATQRIQLIDFIHNIGICGGLMLLVVNGAAKYSVKRFIHVMRLPS